MKAIRITEPGDPEVLRIAEVGDPRVGPSDLLVRIRAAGMNRADLLQRRGLYPAPPGSPPDIPGLEFAGEVTEVGVRARELETFREGDRVMGLLGGGGYAELVSIPAATALPIPAGLTFEEAAAVPEVFVTVSDVLSARGHLRAGESVLIHAAGGGVGTAALQLARVMGAARVFGTGSQEKLARLSELGLAPDVGIDYRRESFGEVVDRETGGRGVDVILDTVGAPYWEGNVASLAPLGRLVLVGLLGGGKARVNLRELMRRRISVVGTVLRARPLAEKMTLASEFRARLLPLFEAGRLRPVVDRVFEMEAVVEAHRYMEANRNVGKVVLCL